MSRDFSGIKSAASPPSSRVTRHRSVIAVDHDATQTAQITLISKDEDPARGASWFRLFRDLVRGGTWAELGSAAKSVLVVLAESVNDQIRKEQQQWLAWPSVPTIARLAGLAERNVYVGLKELESRRLITKLAPGGGRRQTTYQLHCPKESCPSPLSKTAGVTISSGVSKSSAVPGRSRQASPAEDVSQQRKSSSRKKDDSTDKADARVENVDIRQQRIASVEHTLLDIGIKPKTVNSLLEQYELSRIERNVSFWTAKRQKGKTLGVAWLMAAIRDDYCASASPARASNQTQAVATPLVDHDANEAEDLELDRIANQRFEALGDDELEKLAGEVIAEFPWMFRGEITGNLRDNQRLKRLILGRLVHGVRGE
jgi:hypothetical protein